MRSENLSVAPERSIGSEFIEAICSVGLRGQELTSERLSAANMRKGRQARDRDRSEVASPHCDSKANNGGESGGTTANGGGGASSGGGGGSVASGGGGASSGGGGGKAGAGGGGQGTAGKTGTMMCSGMCRRPAGGCKYECVADCTVTCAGARTLLCRANNRSVHPTDICNSFDADSHSVAAAALQRGGAPTRKPESPAVTTISRPSTLSTSSSLSKRSDGLPCSML